MAKIHYTAAGYLVAGYTWCASRLPDVGCGTANPDRVTCKTCRRMLIAARLPVTGEPPAAVTHMDIGPAVKDWPGPSPRGDCKGCAGQCAPVCGRHPAGCSFGGMSPSTSYWMIAAGCPLYHGEETAEKRA